MLYYDIPINVDASYLSYLRILRKVGHQTVGKP